MTGLKSGSGDDLWGDDDEDDVETDADGDDRDENGSGESDDWRASEDSDEASGRAGTRPGESRANDGTGGEDRERPYIVRRAVQDKSVQFEREQRLTFFVRDDVVQGERDLLTDVEDALGRNVPKFDVREAVYRAALRNPEEVLAELLEMGYSLDDD